MCKYAIEEVNRKGTRKNNKQVSSEDGFKDDMKNHNYGNTVINEIETIISLFIDRQDSVLRSKHNAHELTGPLTGLSSLHLYPGEYGDRDIVILYKIHRDDHVVLHGIGNHEYVYSKYRKK